MPTDPELITASGKTQCQVHLASRTEESRVKTLSDKEGLSLGHQPVQGKDETLFSFFDPEAKSEILK